MRRVLLVIEDYNELLLVEKILKKIGFDVESLPSEASLPERMMGFLPDLVIATGEGTRINGRSVSKKVKRKGINSKLLLLFPRQKLLNIDLAPYAAEGAIETPVVPRTLIKAVCEFTEVQAAPILAKFDKLPGNTSAEPEGIQIISGKNTKEVPRYTGGDAKTQPPDAPTYQEGELKNPSRGARYSQILKEAEPAKDLLFSHQDVEAERKRQRAIPDSKEEVAQDALKVDFVKKLYKDWKRK